MRTRNTRPTGYIAFGSVYDIPHHGVTIRVRVIAKHSPFYECEVFGSRDRIHLLPVEILFFGREVTR